MHVSFPRFDTHHRGWLLACLTLGLLTSTLLPGVAEARGAHDRVPLDEAVTMRGGGCGSSCAPTENRRMRSGGGGGGGGRDLPTHPVGGPYWVTTSQTLRSVDPGVSVLIDYVTNRDGQPLDHRFSYERTTIRNVGFSGGYANYFRTSIGGETRRTETRTLAKRVDPWTSLKIYTRQETSRYMVRGRQYQDLADGSRRVVGHASGPYTTSLTRLGYVTNTLR